MLHVAELTSKDDPALDRLVGICPDGTLYASSPYRRFLAECVSGEARYLGAWSEGALVGVLPLFVSAATPLGRIANSLPWFGSHGGCLAAPGFEEAHAPLLDRLAHLAAEEDLLACTVVMPLGETMQLPAYAAQLQPRFIDPRIAQVTPLPRNGLDAERELMMKFRYPGQVRKSLRQGFERLTTDEDWAWDFLHQVHQENMQAVGGKAKPWSHFAALREQLPTSWRAVSIAMLDGRPVAALLLIYFKNTVEYFTPVVRREHRPLQPLSFLIWSAMLEAVERGFTRWNWGGTWAEQTSLHHFKAGWGAHDEPYAYLTLASEAAVETMRENRAALGELFPYYFSYPFRALDAPAGAPS